MGIHTGFARFVLASTTTVVPLAHEILNLNWFVVGPKPIPLL